jgi:PHP family Zn ribbon phosphoesterase
MKLAYDLHIHSALSPCGDNDMTPNNIVNMSCLKGLDIIAVTDHNSAENLEAVMKCSHGKKLIVIPGIEIMTREEVHIVCLFPTLEAALQIQKVVYNSLPNISNREDIFGEQLIFDENDEIVGRLEQMLLVSADLSIEDVFYYTFKLGGVAIPAHVDRTSYSIISNLGSIPENINVNYLEISRNCTEKEYKLIHPELARYGFIRSSDAHYIGDILERESFIELDEASPNCLIDKLRRSMR